MEQRECHGRSTESRRVSLMPLLRRVGHRRLSGKDRDVAERMKRFDRTIALRDATLVHTRPIRADDAPRLMALYDRLSGDTRYHRFFSVVRRLPPDWARFFANVDYDSRLALVVESPEDPDILNRGRSLRADQRAGYWRGCFRDSGQLAGAWARHDVIQGPPDGSRAERRPALPRVGPGRLPSHARPHRPIREVRQRSIEQGVVELRFTARAIESPAS